MEGTIWGSMEGGALRRWDEGLAELASPFDSANPSETVRDRAGALGPSWTGVDTRDACTQAGRQWFICFGGPRSEIADTTSICCSRVSLTAADP